MTLRAALLAALLLAGCSCRGLAGPEPAVADSLASLQGSSFALDQGCGSVEIQSARFEHLLVKPEGDGLTAVVSADVSARWEGASLSYLGLERIPISRELKLPAAPFPALGQLLTLLCQRERARQTGDASALSAMLAESYAEPREPAPEALARLAKSPPPARRRLEAAIRVERDRAEVLEQFAAPEVGGKGYSLRSTLLRQGAGFRIASGLL